MDQGKTASFPTPSDSSPAGDLPRYIFSDAGNAVKLVTEEFDSSSILIHVVQTETTTSW
jgi:hypothetical protein